MRSTRRDRNFAWYAFPAHAATPHTNHHSTLIHTPANPSLPLADPPPPPHGIPAPSHPVEAPTPPQSCLTQPHAARQCVPTVPTPRFPRVAGDWRRAFWIHRTGPGSLFSSRSSLSRPPCMFLLVLLVGRAPIARVCFASGWVGVLGGAPRVRDAL